MLTDLEPVLPLLRRNYETNISPSALRGVTCGICRAVHDMVDRSSDITGHWAQLRSCWR